MLHNVLRNKAILLLVASMMLLTFKASAFACPYGEELVVRSNGTQYCEDVDDRYVNNYYYEDEYPYSYAPYFLPFVYYGAYGGWYDDDDWDHHGWNNGEHFHTQHGEHHGGTFHGTGGHHTGGTHSGGFHSGGTHSGGFHGGHGGRH